MVPNPDAFKALTNLNGNHDFTVVMKWLHDEYERRVDELMTSVDTVRVHQIQGETRCLADFLRSATTAKAGLPRLG